MNLKDFLNFESPKKQTIKIEQPPTVVEDRINESYGRDILSDLIKLNRAMYKTHGKSEETLRMLKKLHKDFQQNPNSEKVLADIDALKEKYAEYFENDVGPTVNDKQPLSKHEMASIETLLKINLAIKKNDSIDKDTHRNIMRRLALIDKNIKNNLPTDEIEQDIKEIITKYNITLD